MSFDDIGSCSMGSGEDRGDWVAQNSNGSGDIAILVVSFNTTKLSIIHHLLIKIMAFRTSNFYMPPHYVPIKIYFVEVGNQPVSPAYSCMIC